MVTTTKEMIESHTKRELMRYEDWWDLLFTTSKGTPSEVPLLLGRVLWLQLNERFPGIASPNSGFHNAEGNPDSEETFHLKWDVMGWTDGEYKSQRCLGVDIDRKGNHTWYYASFVVPFETKGEVSANSSSDEFQQFYEIMGEFYAEQRKRTKRDEEEIEKMQAENKEKSGG